MILFMMTIWSQLGNARPIFRSPNPGIGESSIPGFRGLQAPVVHGLSLFLRCIKIVVEPSLDIENFATTH